MAMSNTESCVWVGDAAGIVFWLSSERNPGSAKAGTAAARRSLKEDPDAMASLCKICPSKKGI